MDCCCNPAGWQEGGKLPSHHSLILISEKVPGTYLPFSNYYMFSFLFSIFFYVLFYFPFSKLLQVWFILMIRLPFSPWKIQGFLTVCSPLQWHIDLEWSRTVNYLLSTVNLLKKKKKKKPQHLSTQMLKFFHSFKNWKQRLLDLFLLIPMKKPIYRGT